MQIDIHKIRLDGETQPREKIEEQQITDYAEDITKGDIFPAVSVFFDGKDYWLADGFHRYHAHKKLGLKTIECKVVNGTKRDAWIFSRGVNANHGLRRTFEERRKVIISCLEDVELSAKPASDREIGRICNVSHMTVGRVRKAMELNKKQDLKAPTNKKPNITPSAPVNPEPETREDKMMELAAEMGVIVEENAKLKDQLAIKTMDTDPEAKAQVETTIDELRAQIKDMEIQLRSVIISRNDFQNKYGEAVKQVTYWKRRAEKAEKKAA